MCSEVLLSLWQCHLARSQLEKIFLEGPFLEKQSGTRAPSRHSILFVLIEDLDIHCPCGLSPALLGHLYPFSHDTLLSIGEAPRQSPVLLLQVSLQNCSAVLRREHSNLITVCRQSDNDNEAIEQIDEDLAVTQSQMNFICPITQMEMKRPVRNKVCGHTYEEDAILKIIQTRKQQKKKVRCPKIGCSHADVKGSDLMPDEALKRAIDSQKKQSWSRLEKSAGYSAATNKICC
ncbi:E3 SUMO-protein ligase NSE2 isoform X2 [Haliaeetus albicilla]|uniref:E3 SUMO-protein ligase NSE2 isoform X2 n=1 Tax=Haliaeetus albicilla TaxID=8969 RepID=UPI0037E753A5